MAQRRAVARARRRGARRPRHPGRSMPLTVLSIGYPLASVADGTAGGAEEILATLDDALVAAGHRSIVVAPVGSEVRGLLLPVPGPAGAPPGAARGPARRGE